MPAEWRSPPETGEIFEDIPTCHHRLRIFSLVEGFAVVKGSGGTRAFPTQTFNCISHGTTTRNFRNFEDKIEKDEEGNIVSQRKKETTAVRQSDCSWEVRVSFKSIGKRNSGGKGFVLTVNSLDHTGHQLMDDPLLIPINMSFLPEYQALKVIASHHRRAIVTYQTSRRVIEATKEFGINLMAKQYYSTVKDMRGDKAAPETIGGLLIALEEAKFVYRTRVEIEEDDSGRENSKKTHPNLVFSPTAFGDN